MHQYCFDSLHPAQVFTSSDSEPVAMDTLELSNFCLPLVDGLKIEGSVPIGTKVMKDRLI